VTDAHETVESLRVDVEYPEHVARTESAEFAANKHRLINKLGLGCWKCGSHDSLEVHHYVIEWSEWQDADPAKVLKVMHKFDAYGFAADGMKQGDPVPTSPDDLRNLMVLCESCHRGAGLGIHLVPVPFWFADLVKKDGATVLKAPKP
jgi:5-methylcytosine-specific restriction endonuclease McrA